MDRISQARALGVEMAQDPWLAHEVKNPDEILRLHGAQGLRLAAQPITLDDHFMLNYWPKLTKLAGSDGEAKGLLNAVLDGYTTALIRDQGFEAIERVNIAARR